MARSLFEDAKLQDLSSGRRCDVRDCLPSAGLRPTGLPRSSPRIRSSTSRSSAKSSSCDPGSTCRRRYPATPLASPAANVGTHRGAGVKLQALAQFERFAARGCGHHLPALTLNGRMSLQRFSKSKAKGQPATSRYREGRRGSRLAQVRDRRRASVGNVTAYRLPGRSDSKRDLLLNQASVYVEHATAFANSRDHFCCGEPERFCHDLAKSSFHRSPKSPEAAPENTNA